MPDTEETFQLLREMRDADSNRNVVKGLDGDKKKAADSIAIETDTGADSKRVYGDYDNFNKRRKAQLAQEMVEKDEKLAQYVRSEPLASTVSKDDWGNLSHYSEKWKELTSYVPYSPPAIMARALPDMWDEVKAGFKTITEAPEKEFAHKEDVTKQIQDIRDASQGLEKGPAWTPAVQQQFDNYLQKYGARYQHTTPLMGVMQILGAPFIGMFRSEISRPLEERFGIPMDVTEGLGLIAGAAFGVKQFRGEGLKAAKEGAPGGYPVGDPKSWKQSLDIATRTVERGEPWLRNGESVPIGIDSAYDQIIGLESKQKSEILDSIIDAGNKAETKELSPELWHQLTKIMSGDQNIHIRWEAIKALYGDKPPMPDDGLLGFVPDIAQQMENAKLTGESIQIKLADWVAKVDPEINKLLHDDLAFPDGMTVKEAKSLPPSEQNISVIPETAFPELPQELDKPYSLSKGKEGLYDILDETGAKAAGVRITETEGGKNLYVHWETGQIDVAGLRTLMKQLKEEYPNAETISGSKVPGMEALERGLQGSKINVDMPFRFKETTEDLVRKSAGLEPLFDLPREGPRAIRLVKTSLPSNVREATFQITDELGKPIGELETSARRGGKEIHIDWIGNFLDDREIGTDLKNKLGPKLIRNLFRELKTNFPNATTISGDRVTGARGAIGKLAEGDITIDMAKLQEESEKAPAGWEGHDTTIGPETQKLVDLTQGWAKFGGDLIAQRQREWTPQELALESKISKMLDKMAPKELRVYGAEDIRMGKEQRRVYGVMQMYQDRRPLVLWSLESPDPVGTARHEAVHFLRQYGYLTDKEWGVLEKHVKDTNAIEKHGIESRYPKADESLKLEEAIAEEFRTWQREPKSDHPLAKVFQKVQEILENIKSAYREFLGREPTADDIFKDIERGRVGRRTPGEGQIEGLHRTFAQEELLPPVEPEGVPTFEPGALMDKARYAKYQNLINKRNQEDAARTLEKAKKDITRREKPEWKKNWKETQAEVIPEIAKRPDWQVSQFFRNGMFHGMETKYMPKIDPKFLTADQKKGMPERFVSKGGMDPDAMAGSFGYSTGEAMVNKLIDFEKAKGDLGPKEFFEKMVKEETDRRMEVKYGNLSENILKEAMDHVIGTTQMDLLHEETLALAARAGQELPLSKADLKAQAAIRFNGEVASGVSMKRYMREMYRAGKTAELAFLKGDWLAAFVQKQAQVHLFSLADHAKKFERTQEKFEGIVREFNKRDIDPKRIPAEYTEWIHSILFQIGRPPKRLPADLERMIKIRDFQNLKDFVEDKNKLFGEGAEFEGDVNPNLVVWDKLMDDPGWKKGFGDLIVGEVKAINDSLQSLKKIGMDEGKYLREGEGLVLKDLIGNMKNQLSMLGEKEPIRDTLGGLIKKGSHTVLGGLLQPEVMFDRWDRGNKRGVFTKMFSMPLNAAASEYSAMQRKFAKKITDIDKKYGMSWSEKRRKVENDTFYEPIFMEKAGQIPSQGGHWMQMTKEHVRGVILNMGNPSNAKRLAEGYNTTPEKIMAWLDKVAEKKDWDWAKEIGKVYEDIQKDSDEMTFRMSGTLVEMLPLGKVMTKHGEYDGWYYPIIYDRTRGGGPRLKEGPPPPTVARTYTGWERKRSGMAGPLDLTLNEMGNFVSRRLKDNAFREVLHNTHKIWANNEFRGAVRRYYGDFAVSMLDSYHADLAGRTGLTSTTAKSAGRVGEQILQNTIGTLIAYNPGTVMKHGASAFLQSWKEAGMLKPDFYKATQELFISTPKAMMADHDFIMNGAKIGNLEWEGSTELQKRHQHWAETIGGAGDIQLKKMNAREQFLYYGSYPVAWSDMFSSKILWKAKYDKTMRETGNSLPLEEAHLDAVQQADYAVRRTHGSTSITSRPEFMRSQNVFNRNMVSLYGFFNHVFNRFYRMGWEGKDLAQGTARGEKSFKEFAKGSADLTSDFMMYIVGPALVEALVVEGAMSMNWDDMGWGELIGKGMIHTVSASIPLVRDIVHATVTGHDPSAGLLGATYKGVTDFGRQLGKEQWDVGKTLQTGITMMGITTGLGSAQLGKWARFTYNYLEGEERPSGAGDWYRAFRTGTTLPRKGH